MIWLPWIAFAAIVLSMAMVGFRSKKQFLIRRAEEQRMADEQKQTQEQQLTDIRAQQQMILDELRRQRQTNSPSPSQGFSSDLATVLGGKTNPEARPN